MVDLFRKRSAAPIRSASEEIKEISVRTLDDAEKLVSLGNSDMDTNLEERLEKLRDLGITSTGNFRALEEKVNAEARIRSDRKTLLGNLEDYKAVRDVGLTIIPWTEFFGVCKRHAIFCGPIKVYTGTIPEENLDQILGSRHEITEAVDYSGHLFVGVGDKRLRLLSNWIKRIVVYKRKGDLCKEFLDIASVLPIGDHPLVLEAHHRCMDSIESVRKESYAGLWIAAPNKNMENSVTIESSRWKSKEEKMKAEDPIVFYPTAAGPLIISMWDKEAEDPVFRRY